VVFIRSCVSFILAFLLSAVIIIYAACITSANPESFKYFLSFESNGDIIFMGKAYTPDEKLLQRVSDYISLCNKASGVFMPDIITLPLKNTATVVFTAAADAFGALHAITRQFVFGNR